MDELLQKDFVETKLYRNNLKNREFGKEGPQNFCSERATIAYGQGANENTNSEVNPMDQGSPKTQRLWSRALLKPDSSSCFSISVEFQNYTFIECAIDAVRLISNPHIILWYIGCNGLRKSGIDFYRNFIISPLKIFNPKAMFWFLDLTAWSAFKHTNGSIHKSSRCCEAIEAFHDARFKCIKSSRLFERMCESKKNAEIENLKQNLPLEFLTANSLSFPHANIAIKDIFPHYQSIATEFSDWDTAKAYSIFQYLEAHLIVKEILSRLATPRSFPVELVFLLPNDELKYYRDPENSFERVLRLFLLDECADPAFKLRIRFYSFPYGTNQDHRPYNAPGDVIKKNQLTYEAVAGMSEIL